MRDGDNRKCIYCGKHKLSYDCYSIKLIVDRIAFLKQRGLCLACLKPASTVHNCEVRCPICDKAHDISTCMQLASMMQFQKNTARAPPQNRNESRRNEGNPPRQREHGRQNVIASNYIQGHASQVHSPRLQTGQVTVHGSTPDCKRRVAFLLDTGASVSLVSKELAEELSLQKLYDVESTVCGLGDRTDGPKVYPLYEVPLQSITGQELVIRALGYAEPIVGTLEYPPLSRSDLEMIRRKNLILADECEKTIKVQPRLLLGNRDYLTVTMVKKKRIKLPSGNILLPSLLGWIASGGEAYDSNRSTVAYVADRKSAMREINESLQTFLSLENCVKDDSEQLSKETSVVDDYFRDNVRVENGRVHTRYCVREDALGKLSTNLKCSHARMRNVISSLRAKNMLQTYDEIIKKHIVKDHVEIVEPPKDERRMCYLPHHPVFRIDKPEKPIRIVFDASAKERGKLSLNDCMRESQVRLERIPGLLLRARCSPSIILSDVEAAFLQVVIAPEQRDMMRFLWLKNARKPMNDGNVVHLRFKVAPFGISQSPYLLEASIRYHVGRTRSMEKERASGESDFVLDQLEENVYVDNVMFECNSNTNKLDVYNESKRIFSLIGMNLREFVSDDISFVESLPPEDRGRTGMQKILGAPWCSKKDQFFLGTRSFISTEQMSKRSILSKLASVFDPLGWLAPLLLPAKLFVQEMWTRDYGWDTQISEEDRKAWTAIERDVAKFSYVLPRRFLEAESEWILVAFADASRKSMAACVYVVGRSGANLAMARSQLAPLKNKLTIPRLEFRALLLAVKLLRFVLLSITKTRLHKVIGCRVFSDSTIALHWAVGKINQNSERGSRNVCKTSEKISIEKKGICRELHGEACKRERDCVILCHVRSEENPADWATRGVPAQKMMAEGSMWWSGPEWLTIELVEKRCPFDPTETPEAVVNEANELNSPQPVLAIIQEPKLRPMFDTTRFSTWKRMMRVMAYVRRHVRARFSKLEGVHSERLARLVGDEPTDGPLTVGELNRAKCTILKLHQLKHIDKLKDPGNRNLQLFMDKNGLYRCGHQRLENSALVYDIRCPIFVPGGMDDHLVTLIIREAHVNVMHSGENHTLDAVRWNYWVVKARRAVRKVLRNCTSCRRALAAPFPYPSAPDLPEARVTRQRPFQHVGMDYAGPFLVKQKEERVKVYVLLVTCMTTRAVHFEVTSSLSAVDFMASFRRFTSRRGVPDRVMSDNAPTFHWASDALKEGTAKNVSDDMFPTYLAMKGVKWDFTVPHAPWQGGIYERLVGLMKSCLTRTIGRKLLDRGEFETMIVEIEAVVNNRPLVHLSDDRKDEGRVIRPSDFIMPMGGAMGLASDSREWQDVDYHPPESNENSMRSQCVELESRLQKYWELFRETYITTLRDRARASVRTGRTSARSPRIGEIVLLKEEITPRGSWPMGRIIECTEREAMVRTGAGSYLRRPLNLLVPLEVYSTDEESLPYVVNDESSKETTAPTIEPREVAKPPKRPIRGCKSLARDPEYCQMMRK